MKNNIIHLKQPCPFCGSVNLDFDNFSEGNDAIIRCEDCSAEGPIVTIGCRDNIEEINLEKEAWDIWNQRK